MVEVLEYLAVIPMRIFSICKSVFDYKSLEKDSGLLDISTYSYFQESSEKIKFNFLDFLLEQKESKKSSWIVLLQGNTLLNFCGIKNDLCICCRYICP